MSRRIFQSDGVNSGTYTIWDEYTADDEDVVDGTKAKGEIIAGSYKTGVILQNNYDGTYHIMDKTGAVEHTMLQQREGITDGTREKGGVRVIDPAPDYPAPGPYPYLKIEGKPVDPPLNGVVGDLPTPPPPPRSSMISE